MVYTIWRSKGEGHSNKTEDERVMKEMRNVILVFIIDSHRSVESGRFLLKRTFLATSPFFLEA